MQAAVKGMLHFSSNLQHVPGLVELHGEPENWPACEFRSCRVSFTWFIGQENATVDSRERRLQEQGYWEGQGSFLCQPHLDWLSQTLLPVERRWLLCLGIYRWQKAACLFQRQQHGPFLSQGCVLGLYEWAAFHVSHPQCFSVLQNFGQVMSTPPTLHQWLKESQTNVYFESTGKGKKILNYLLQSYMFTSLYLRSRCKRCFLPSKFISSLLRWCSASAYLCIAQTFEAIFLLIM